jgi:hypothetical protein
MRVSKRNNHQKNECRVCLGEHDAAIHEATLNARLWFREQFAVPLERVDPSEREHSFSEPESDEREFAFWPLSAVRMTGVGPAA